MRVSKCVFMVALACLSNVCLVTLAAGQSDQAATERVIGPQWKQLSQRAGMIFTGTLLPATASPAPQTPPRSQLRFRVDHAIAGVEPGQILTVHQWTGASSMHRPMRSGQHILLFLHPESPLGLTSPVGGSSGQILLDSTGTKVFNNVNNNNVNINASGASVTVPQLERAIRSAREALEAQKAGEE
jgi:hypothetical protein